MAGRTPRGREVEGCGTAAGSRRPGRYGFDLSTSFIRPLIACGGGARIMRDVRTEGSAVMKRLLLGGLRGRSPPKMGGRTQRKARGGRSTSPGQGTKNLAAPGLEARPGRDLPRASRIRRGRKAKHGSSPRPCRRKRRIRAHRLDLLSAVGVDRRRGRRGDGAGRLRQAREKGGLAGLSRTALRRTQAEWEDSGRCLCFPALRDGAMRNSARAGLAVSTCSITDGSMDPQHPRSRVSDGYGRAARVSQQKPGGGAWQGIDPRALLVGLGASRRGLLIMAARQAFGAV